ncbi:hypothetical protein PTKIN_Ptkin05aG0142400 [Pterospermum kingtungense]
MKRCVCSETKKKSRIQITWAKPEVGEVKFNVDRVVAGKPGPVGIGGVLRDHIRLVLIKFSKSIGMAELNLAEILAICEAFKIFLSSHWESCKVKEWKVNHVFKECNQVADGLAKDEMKGVVVLVVETEGS